jgi:hypothetical protein
MSVPRRHPSLYATGHLGGFALRGKARFAEHEPANSVETRP